MKMKKAMILILSAALSFGTVAAPVFADTVSVPDSAVDGGWEVNQKSLAPKDNREAMQAFRHAMEELTGYDYEVISCLGSQVVAGTNYSYLCKGTVVYPGAESEYMIVNVYEDLDGNARVTGVRDLLDVNSETEDGGWSYNQGDSSVTANTDVRKSFEKATGELDGAEYEPVAYIGSQVVSGMNYAVFCSVKPVVPGAQRTFALVTVYSDPDGDAKITETEDIDLDAGTGTTDTFSDVSKDSYDYDAIQWAAGSGIAAGTSDTTFSPYAACSRAEMVTFLYRMAGSPAVTGNMPFTDVKKSDFYYDAVLWASKNHITAGVSSTAFSPKKSCSRGEAVTALYRLKGRPAVSGKQYFTDVNRSMYCSEAVSWAKESGVTKGKTDQKFQPNDICTRGQMVTFLYRYHKAGN